LLRIRAALLASLLVMSGLVSQPVLAQDRPAIPAAATSRMAEGLISELRVEGNQRIETATIRSYMQVQPGDPFDP